MSGQQATPQKRPEGYHCPCCAEAEAEITRLRADHDRRVAELLEANGREVERRRRVEAELAQARAILNLVAGGLPTLIHDLLRLGEAVGRGLMSRRIARAAADMCAETGRRAVEVATEGDPPQTPESFAARHELMLLLLSDDETHKTKSGDA